MPVRYRACRLRTRLGIRSLGTSSECRSEAKSERTEPRGAKSNRRFRKASFLERSSVERFDPEGFANKPEGEWRSSGISGALEIGAGQRVTDEDFARFGFENRRERRSPGSNGSRGIFSVEANLVRFNIKRLKKQ